MFVWLITAVAVKSQGKIAVSELEETKVSASKSTSAPAEVILKCVVPPGAAMMFAGINESILQLSLQKLCQC